MQATIFKFKMALVLVSMLSLTACSKKESSSLVAGQLCTVQFRRDALGAGATLPISPLVGAINGAETSITGNLKRVNDDWIVIEKSGDEISIPRGVILVVQQRLQ